MKHSNYIAVEGISLIEKIREVPTVLKLFFVAFLFFLLLPFTSSAAVI